MILILVSILLFSISLFFYLNDVSLRKILFGLTDDDSQVLIGKLVSKTGSIRRQGSGETEFKEIADQSPLYNMDVLVTSETAGAHLEFTNGGSIDLGPNTMVRLAFLTEIAFGGINRFGKVEVVSGQVKAEAGNQKILVKSLGSQESLEVAPHANQQIQAKKVFQNPQPLPSPSPSAVPVAPSPTPPPAPTFTAEEAEKVKILLPKKNEQFTVENNARVAQKNIPLVWKMNPENGEAQVTIWKILPGGELKQVFEKIIPAKKGQGKYTFNAQEPGDYHWEIRGPTGKAISTEANTKSSFGVYPEFIGIKSLSPLFGGKTSTSNKLSGDLLTDFDIVLRWEQYPQLNQYRIWFGKSPTSNTALLERTVDKPEFSFNKKKIFTGQVYYKVTGKLPNGFIVSSGVQKFTFNFLPPVQMTPEDNANLELRSLRREGNRILFTWQKTNFTAGYEIEIAKDPKFTQLFLKRALKENYFVLPAPAEGQYWWRVRGFSKELSSPMSSSFNFKISP